MSYSSWYFCEVGTFNTADNVNSQAQKHSLDKCLFKWLFKMMSVEYYQNARHGEAKYFYKLFHGS